MALVRAAGQFSIRPLKDIQITTAMVAAGVLHRYASAMASKFEPLPESRMPNRFTADL